MATPATIRGALTLLCTMCMVVTLCLACDRELDATQPGDLWSDATDASPLPDVAFWPTGDAIRVATWNVERFFDPVCDSGRCGIGAFEALPTPSDFRVDAERVSSGIAEIDAHIVLVQEIESQRCLDALRELLPTYPVAILAETDAPGSVNVGVFARGRLIQVLRHRDRPLTLPDGSTSTFAREFLEVRLSLGEDGPDAEPNVIVFVAHFKSKRGDEPERRIAEAREARAIVLETAALYPDALIVLGGDLNDTPDSDALAVLTADDELRRVADDVAPHLTATYTFNNTDRAIDHLLQATTAGGRYIAGTARSIGHPGGHAGSDHAALTAWFTLP